MEFVLKPPEPLVIDNNIAENWERFANKLNIFLIAADLINKSEERKIAVFLNFVGDDGLKIYDSLKFKEEKTLQVVLEKFEKHCLSTKDIETNDIKTIDKESSIEQWNLFKTEFGGIYSDVSNQLNSVVQYSEECWLLASRKDLAMEEKNNILLHLKVKSILEELKRLFFNLRSLDIKTENHLEDVVNLLYDSAVKDPQCSSLYTTLCKEMSLIKEFSNLRRLMNARCLQECDAQIKASEVNHTKSLKNSMLFCELFRQQLLPVNTVKKYLQYLISKGDEESLECMCKQLINNDLVLKQTKIDHIFKTMQDMVKNKHLISIEKRVIIEDSLEFRGNVLPQEVQKDIAAIKDNLALKTKLAEEHSDERCEEPAKKKVNVPNLNMMANVELNYTKNPWKPSRLRDLNDNEGDKDLIMLRITFRSILNKLAPKNFNCLVAKVKKLKIDNFYKLQTIVDLIYKKAIKEPDFQIFYALMSRELALIQVPTLESTPEQPEFANFRKLLITSCQREFEKHLKNGALRENLAKEIDKFTKKEELRSLVEEYNEKSRKIRIGNLKFIGELFKQQILTVNILLRCINSLLDDKNEESLECLCVFLKTIGKELEMKNACLDPIFKMLHDIMEKNEVSKRVKFLLLDVIELRSA